MLKLSDILTFGKHKDRTVQEVIDDEPGYLSWAIDTIEWFELDVKAEEELEKAILEDEKSLWAYTHDDYGFR